MHFILTSIPQVTQELIKTRGFSAVVFEADWPMMEQTNEYVHRRAAKPYPEEMRFPTWMWKNAVMSDFWEWCRKQPEPPNLFGMDCYSLFESKRKVRARACVQAGCLVLPFQLEDYIDYAAGQAMKAWLLKSFAMQQPAALSRVKIHTHARARARTLVVA